MGLQASTYDPTRTALTPRDKFGVRSVSGYEPVRACVRNVLAVAPKPKQQQRNHYKTD